MTDLELLEAAAKAAGLELVPYTWDKGAPWGEHQGFTLAGTGPNEWSPLHSDEQAFRLAALLGLSIEPYPLYTQPKHSVIVKQRRRGDQMRESNPTECVELYRDSDCYTATRRAIVRAAAAAAALVAA